MGTIVARAARSSYHLTELSGQVDRFP